VSTSYVPRNTPLLDDRGLMSEAWYRYFQELHQWSGLAGHSFPLYAGLLVPALAMVLDTAAPPGVASVSGNAYALAFDAAALERARFAVLLPHGYTPGTPLVPVVRWAPSSAAAGVVRWVLEYSVAPVGGLFAAPASVTLDVTAGGAAGKHQHAQGDAIAGSGLLGSSVALCSVHRDAAAGADTYGVDAFLLAAGFAVENSAHGSQTVTPTG
jgi:hypothetical protein